MLEKVNPSHPDKLADRIAGAIVDLAYTKSDGPKISVEVLIGHGVCHIISEASVDISRLEASNIVQRIAGEMVVDLCHVPQDEMLSRNQDSGIRCGDNGIFKGVPISREQRLLGTIAREIYVKYPTDGKYILDEQANKLIICQSLANSEDIKRNYPHAIINPLGDWVGGLNVDTGATNRKLGSDMADAVTGGGLHGKDLSKADVSVNVFAHLQAQKTGRIVEYNCAIGDTSINGIPYAEIVETAKEYIWAIGGFERLAEWGLY